MEILIENRYFFTHTPLHSTPPLEGPHQNIAIPFGIEKPECCGYPTVKKVPEYYLVVSTEYRRMTDRQTFCESIVRAMRSVAR